MLAEKMYRQIEINGQEIKYFLLKKSGKMIEIVCTSFI